MPFWIPFPQHSRSPTSALAIRTLIQDVLLLGKHVSFERCLKIWTFHTRTAFRKVQTVQAHISEQNFKNATLLTSFITLLQSNNDCYKYLISCHSVEKDVEKGRRKTWKEEALDDLPWKDQRRPSSNGQKLEPFQFNSKAKLGELLRDGVDIYGLYMGFSECTDIILNWTEWKNTENQSTCLQTIT